jgi:hypothetical protein
MSYDEESLFQFFKAYIEEQTPQQGEDSVNINRENKSKYENKVNVERDNIFVCNVIKHKASNVQYDENSFAKLYNKFRANLKDRCMKDIKKENFEDILLEHSKMRISAGNIQWVKNNWSKFGPYGKYVFLLEIYYLEYMDDMVFKTYKMNLSYAFRVAWKLWTWICIQAMDCLWRDAEYSISDERVEVMLKELEEQILLLENSRVDRKTKDIFDDYYLHNLYLIIRDDLAQELEAICILSESTQGFSCEIKHYPLSEKYLFANDEDMDKKTMKEKFCIGCKDCDMETFTSRIAFCKEFIDIYNAEANRNLDYESNKTLRAVYRALYIDEISYKRQKLFTIAKKITMEPKWTEHYILGSIISTLLMTEYPNGEKYIEVRKKCTHVLYRIAFKMFIDFCPYPLELDIDNNLYKFSEESARIWEIIYKGFGNVEKYK